MDAKEYLEQIGTLEHKIKMMKIRAKEYERLSYSVPGPTYGEKIGSNPNINTEAPFVKWIHKQMDLEKKIESLQAELDNLRAEAMLKIEQLENEDYKNLLILRYLSGNSWDEIASKLFVVRRTIMRWHEDALALLSI